MKMGTPLFQMRSLIQQHQIQVFSSNYALYGDLSRRVGTEIYAVQMFSFPGQ